MFALGVILVIQSDFYGFDQLWIVLGLVGYALTFLTGLLVIKPRGERLRARCSPRAAR